MADADRDPWFPDLLARWYDEFSERQFDPVIDRWRYNRPRLVDDWIHELLLTPHSAALRIQRQIAAEPTVQGRIERIFRALQASSLAVEKAGITPVLEYGGAEWTSIRQRWWQHGNLARNVPGFVLPRRGRRFGWQGTRPEPKVYHARSMFGGFLRFDVPREVSVVVRTMSNQDVPIEALSTRLRIAVAPLVTSMNELRFEPIDDDGGRRSFRVALTDPRRVAQRAMRAVRRSGRLGCDVIVFPELCLSPEGQQILKSSAASLASRSGGRPWLILAGSAHTPADHGGHHNRALVFDSQGSELLVHNKLYPYEMSRREADRYGIGEALRREPRVEDIVVLPRRLEVLECALGRTAVLICEDLSNRDLGAVLQDLEIDWLLVPVMDGVQTRSRWTARYSEIFAREYGINVLVGTCGALVTAHRAEMMNGGAPDPGNGCALFTQLRSSAVQIEPLETGGIHPSLAVFDVTA